MNTEIQQAMKANGVKQWQVAEKLNINEFVFSRWFRHELSEKQRNAVLAAIKEIHEEKQA